MRHRSRVATSYLLFRRRISDETGVSIGPGPPPAESLAHLTLRRPLRRSLVWREFLLVGGGGEYFKGFLLTLSILLLPVLFSGCYPSSRIDLPETKSIPTNEGVVFGRVKIINDGEVMTDFHTGYNVSMMRIVILPDDSSEKIEYAFYHDGSFVWHLPPGGYTIGTFETKRRPFTADKITGRIFAHFDVVNDEVTYIGTITLDFKGLRYRKFVEDEYELAIEQFRKKFPEIKREPRRSLMVLEKQR